MSKTNNDIELEEIRIYQKALGEKLKELEAREQDIGSHIRGSLAIIADETIVMSDVSESEINYVLGQSQGFVNGYNKAMDSIVSALSSEYRNIPMTESELYMLVELGADRERAWLKNLKNGEVAEKAGWRCDYAARVPVWKKEEKSDEADRMDAEDKDGGVKNDN